MAVIIRQESGSLKTMDEAPRRMKFSERRESIVAAACRVIGDRGIDVFRIHEVAEAAGVSQPLVSRHFRSRDELVQAAFVFADERSNDIGEQRVPAGDNGRERLLHFLQSYVYEDDPDLNASRQMWTEVWSSRSLSEGLSQIVRDRQRVWLQTLQGFIKEGQEDGSVGRNVDPKRAALFVAATTDGLLPGLERGTVDRDTAKALIAQAVEAALR